MASPVWDPEAFSAGVGGTELIQDSRPAPSLAAPYRAVTVRPLGRLRPRLDDWADLLDVDLRTFLEVLRDVPWCVRGEVSHVDITDGVAEVRLRSLPDPVRLGEFSRELEIHLERTTREIFTLAGEEFNIGSPKQLAHSLFEKLKLPPES